jgi:prepilin-type N-terminal cleavage/methylation domain-containing protein
MPKSNKGFTLIETLVYLALLGLIFTGLFAGGFAIMESFDLLKTKAFAQEEGNFLLAKIDWAMNGATGIDISVDPVAETLTVDKGKIYLKSDGGLYWQDDNGRLNKSNNAVTPVPPATTIFIHAGGGPDPESLTAKFRLETKTPAGRVCFQDFELTVYLRK